MELGFSLRVETMQSFLTEQEVSKRLNVSVATLRRWRLEKRGPMFVKVGSLVRYRPEDLDSWVSALPTGGAVAVLTSGAASERARKESHCRNQAGQECFKDGARICAQAVSRSRKGVPGGTWAACFRADDAVRNGAAWATHETFRRETVASVQGRRRFGLPESALMPAFPAVPSTWKPAFFAAC